MDNKTKTSRLVKYRNEKHILVVSGNVFSVEISERQRVSVRQRVLERKCTQTTL